MKISKALILVLVLAGVFRLYQLGSNPPHLSPDEAALGYNAYSILRTGKDEWGEVLPLIFKSFGDYKPGLYVYLSVPFVYLFGLSESVVRLPSAILGIGIVYLVYLVVWKVFGEKKIALASAFVASVNPWLVHFSRGAWEANVSLFLTLIGVYWFLVGVKRHKYLIGSALFFGMTLLTYQGAKLSSLIVVGILLVVYRKDFLRIPNKIKLSALLVGVLVVVPVMLSFFQGKAARLEVYSIFSYPRESTMLGDFLSEAGVEKDALEYRLFYSEGHNFLRGILGRWTNHFSARYLFFEGDWQNPRHSSPNHGVLLVADMALMIIGLVGLTRVKNKRARQFVVLWLVGLVMPAALSRDGVQGVRALVSVFGWVIVLGAGWVEVFKWRKGWIIAMGLVYVGSLVYFVDALFVHLPNHESQHWGYGYKQIVTTVAPIQNEYEQVIVQQSFDQPYIYFLFFQKYDPRDWQAQAKYVPGENKFDVGKVERMDNIIFGPIDWSLNKTKPGILVVADEVKMPISESSDATQFEIIQEIKYLDGKHSAFRIVATR